jgi:hypothetical protein
MNSAVLIVTVSTGSDKKFALIANIVEKCDDPRNGTGGWHGRGVV